MGQTENTARKFAILQSVAMAPKWRRSWSFGRLLAGRRIVGDRQLADVVGFEPTRGWPAWPIASPLHPALRPPILRGILRLRGEELGWQKPNWQPFLLTPCVGGVNAAADVGQLREPPHMLPSLSSVSSRCSTRCPAI